MTDLATEIERAGKRLGGRVLDAMYEDPFWEARYGARGRLHADEDSAYHVTYLVEALRSGNSQVMTRYACWLRSVLVPRGMCSAHLAENFERLAALISAELADVAPALRVLEEARLALRYQSGPGAFLEAKAPELIRALKARLGELDAPGVPTHARPASLLSYLADALQLQRPELFLDHVGFLLRFYRAQPRSSQRLANTLAALEGALEEQPEHERQAPLLLQTVRAARQRLKQSRESTGKV